MFPVGNSSRRVLLTKMLNILHPVAGSRGFPAILFCQGYIFAYYYWSLIYEDIVESSTQQKRTVSTSGQCNVQEGDEWIMRAGQLSKSCREIDLDYTTAVLHHAVHIWGKILASRWRTTKWPTTGGAAEYLGAKSDKIKIIWWLNRFSRVPYFGNTGERLLSAVGCFTKPVKVTTFLVSSGWRTLEIQ